jgi:hypothetical protein
MGRSKTEDRSGCWDDIPYKFAGLTGKNIRLLSVFVVMKQVRDVIPGYYPCIRGKKHFRHPSVCSGILSNHFPKKP